MNNHFQFKHFQIRQKYTVFVYVFVQFLMSIEVHKDNGYNYFYN